MVDLFGLAISSAIIWSNKDRRIITGADILGRLLKGIEPES